MDTPENIIEEALGLGAGMEQTTGRGHTAAMEDEAEALAARIQALVDAAREEGRKEGLAHAAKLQKRIDYFKKAFEALNEVNEICEAFSEDNGCSPPHPELDPH